MAKSDHNKLYKLHKYIISKAKTEIVAIDFIYFPKINKIREICHPAVLDKVKNILIIKKYILKGKDTTFTLDTFNEFISKLPDWDLTDFFQIKNQIYNNSEIHKCSFSPFLEIEQNNGNL